MRSDRGSGHSSLSPRELERYNRQLILPGWGEAAQARLRRAVVFVAGAGGLGSPVAQYLAAAGVGTLRICDSGRVELSNLNRQLLHADRDVAQAQGALGEPDRAARQPARARRASAGRDRRVTRWKPWSATPS